MIANGTRLGPYEVTAQLGAGGMGEVYRAVDSRLDRSVAIKVLPSHLSADKGLRERFEREARAISALSHPHICTLYDIGSHDGVDYLVMEYLEGESLAERLERGPLPIEQVLRYGVEIAEALEKAHRAGIIHRDLKPGNVILTKSGAKLLDFGLAKFAQSTSLSASDPHAETAAMSKSKPLTEEGSILGTFQYMAPEQIEARDADARTDIFALGSLLYEMATGKRAFEARSKASLIASILDREPPPISTIQPLTPPAFERLVRMCLAKEPDERWQSAHDVAAELKWIATSSSDTIGPGARRRSRRSLLRNAALLLAGIFAGVVAAWLLSRGNRREVSVARVSIRTSASAPLLRDLGALALSPDGKDLVYRAIVGGKTILFRRAIDRLGAEPLPGTEDGHSPVFSPDGRWIAFEAQSGIWKVPRDGGTRVKLSDSPGGALGVTWLEDTVYFTRAFTGGLWAVPAAGGKPRQIVKTDAGKGQRAIVWPDALPGGQTLLATVWNGGAWDEARIVAFDIASGASRPVLDGGAFARYASSGHLLFLRGGNLMATTFDPKTLKTGPNAVAVVNGISNGSADGEAHYAISPSGHLAYVSGADSEPLATLVWVDSSGRQQPIVPTPRRYGSVALAPDARTAAVTIQESTYDIWLLDHDRDALTRLSHGGDDSDAVITPDGERVIWSSGRSGEYNLFWRRLDGRGGEEPLIKVPTYQELPSVSPDGRVLVYTQYGKKLDLWTMSLETRKSQPLIASEFSESGGTISPDGRWLAYASDESRKREVYVTSFPEATGKWQVSTDGGIAPRWMPNGREIVYMKDRQLFIVPIELTPKPRAGKPRLLVQGNFDDEYSIAPDGRVALAHWEERPTAADVTLVLNWVEELKRRVPTK